MQFLKNIELCSVIPVGRVVPVRFNSHQMSAMVGNVGVEVGEGGPCTVRSNVSMIMATWTPFPL